MKKGKKPDFMDCHFDAQWHLCHDPGAWSMLIPTVFHRGGLKMNRNKAAII